MCMQLDFQEALAELNPAQRSAVEAIDGPVLVVAGPGTGKTQLLSLRVANILKQTDTDPANILCLTFTNFAATNMRDRLVGLIGSEARRIMVRTFHSFAAELMNLYPDYFWSGARLGVAPDAVQLDIIQDILMSLPLSHPLALKFAGSYTALSDVQQALRLVKEAGLTPEKLAAMLAVNDAYLDVIEPELKDILSAPLSIKKLDSLQAAVEALPDQPIEESVTPLRSLSTVIKSSLQTAIELDERTGKTTETGKWKRRWIQSVAGEKAMFDERRRNAWWHGVVEVYEGYRERLHARGFYDYSDMLVEVISQLEQHPELLASVQERFSYVLIDEFQDTNAAQLRLAHLVATHESTGGKPNLMAVGDDDQSIFAFNGAELSNMLAFRDAYPGTEIIVLRDNYRSSQAILDTAEKVIVQASDRLVTRDPTLTKHLVAAKETRQGTIEHIAYPTRELELSGIAERVQQTYNDSPDSSIAVLARSHDSLKQLSAQLNKLGIPMRYEQQNDILSEDSVRQLRLMSEVIVAIGAGDEQAVSNKLSDLLRHPMWHIDPAELWNLAVENYGTSNWLNSMLTSTNEQLGTIARWLLSLAQLAAHEPLAVMVEYLIGLRAGEGMTSPLREYYLSLEVLDEVYLRTLSALQLLMRLGQEFSGSRDTTLADFVRFLQLNEELGRTITDQSWYVSQGRAVELMTVHKAKGLEFDTVFLLDAVEDNWRPRRIGRKPPANLPLEPYGEHDDDYIRLMYVAATRARTSFIVSSYSNDPNGNEVLPTPLISTVIKAMEAKKMPRDVVVASVEAAMQWPRLVQSDERALLHERLESFRLSATSLLQFLDVTTGGPTAFLEKHLLRVPQPATPMMGYGTAMHTAMQGAQQLTNIGKLEIKEIEEIYGRDLARQRLTRSEFERYLPHGKLILNHVFTELSFSLPKGGEAEISLGDVGLGDIRLGGKLDQLTAMGNELQITDYKTGKPLGSLATRDQTKAVKAWRHQTQLTFYAMLARASERFKNTSAITTRLVYLEAETARDLELRFSPTGEQITMLENLASIIWNKVMELDLPDTSAYPQTRAGIDAFIKDLTDGSI
jgi:DNA helicase-2/ATP-dependent DNA helicase PcrA